MKIPGYQDQGNITTASPAAKRDPRQAGMIGENIQEVGKIISRTGQQIGDIVDYRRKVAEERQRLQDETETMKAQIELTQKMNNIRLEAEKDPDIYNAPKTAREKAAKALEEAGNMVTSEQAREMFKLKSSVDNERYFYNIQAMADKKQIDSRRATLLVRNDQLANEYHKEDDPKIKAYFISQIILNTKQALARGDINRIWGKKYLDDMRKSIAIGQVDYDLGKAYADSDFESKIKDVIFKLQPSNEKGYQNLTPKERMGLIEKAKTTLENARENKEIAQTSYQTEMLKKWDSLTADGAIRDWHNGLISEEMAKTIVKAKQKPKSLKKDFTKGQKKFYKGAQEFINSALKEGISVKDVQSRLVNEYANGKIEDDEVAPLAVLLELDASSKPPVKTGLQKIGDWLAASAVDDMVVKMKLLGMLKNKETTPDQAPAKAQELAAKALADSDPEATSLIEGKTLKTNSHGVKGLYKGRDPKTGKKLYEVDF